MCGIYGILHGTKPFPRAAEVLERMDRALVHRGPDDSGQALLPNCALGMRRLAIIDLDGGKQPLWDAGRTACTVFNGEIYNYRELRTELQDIGYAFRTRSDTESLLHAVQEWGINALPRLNGMFAFCFVDRHSNAALLARDRFGVKPLYYTVFQDRLIFASEIRALLTALPTCPVVDESLLQTYFTYGFVPSPNTLFRSIYRLGPGHYLAVNLADPADVRPVPYVSPTDLQKSVRTPEARERLRELLLRAMERQLVADVDVGILLSSGVDSALILSRMAEALGYQPKSFTIGYRHAPESEIPAAAATADSFGSIHHPVLLSAEDFADTLPQVIRSLEEPSNIASAVPLYQLSSFVHQHVKVALTGQGADEPLMGYPKYRGGMFAGLRFPWTPLSSSAALAIRAPRAARILAAMSAEDIAGSLVSLIGTFPATTAAAILRPELVDQQQDPADPVRRAAAFLPGADPLSLFPFVDARLSLADNLLVYSDKVSMAHSLELRVPFLDNDLVEFCESLPARIRFGLGQPKKLYRDVLRELLPVDILQRPKKGFPVPLGTWLADRLPQLVREHILGPRSALHLYLRDSHLRRIAEHAQRGSVNWFTSKHVFSLISFDVWHRAFIGTL